MNGGTRYAINTKELDRRRTASLTLVVAIAISFGIGLAMLWKTGILLTAALVAGMGVAVGTLRALALRTFRSFKNTVVECSADHMTIVGQTTTHFIAFSDVRMLRLLRTSHGGIRDVTLQLRDGSSVTIDALDSFEQFWDLLKSLGIFDIRERREPLDYDHPIFYAVLGLLVGFAAPLAAKLIALLTIDGMRLLGMAFALFTIALGIYFFWRMPLRRRYGQPALKGDWGFGGALAAAGFILIMYCWP